MKRSLTLLAALLLAPLPALSAADGIERPVRPLRESIPGLRVEARCYPEHAATEWQLRLRNPPEGSAPVYENLKSADFEVAFPANRPVTVHWSKGSHSEPGDFEPKTDQLKVGEVFSLASFGGRSSDGVMPYFNLAGQDRGLIVAVGWSGDWKASFEALADGKVRVTAGLQRCRFKLRPGEEVRLPSVLVMSYTGDWLSGQNQFRRLMLAHFTPANHPPMELMPVAASVHGMFAFNVTSEEKLAQLAADVATLKLPLDTYWLDAGWNQGGFPKGQGNPQADPARFPSGLAPVGAAARTAGLKFAAWFEPERVMRGTRLEREHPDWLLKPSATPERLRYQEKDGFMLLDMGNAQARAWALDNISKDIRDAGIAIYRQDFNLYPAFFWHTDEKPDEVGVREVRHITGLYDYLDELVRRHPALILDNCAAGGRRLDFEMMRRSVVLWRSDSCWGEKTFPRNVQAMTHGLSHWLPLHGLGATRTDDISLRGGMGACASFPINFRNAEAVAALRRHLDRYLKVRPLFAADYYPLTKWSLEPKHWLAFQFHDPAKGAGIIQAFSDGTVTERVRTLNPRGLDPTRTYRLTDWDKPSQPITRTGADLLAQGVEVTASEDHQALVLEYQIEP
jgi:alpha-galactosidase